MHFEGISYCVCIFIKLLYLQDPKLLCVAYAAVGKLSRYNETIYFILFVFKMFLCA